MQNRLMPNRLFVLLIIVGFVMPSLSLNISANEGDITPTREDRAEIVRDVLNREITRRREGESKHGAVKKGEVQIILSTLNIEPEVVPKLTDVKFILMKPSEIQVLRKSSLAFSEFRVEGSKVIVTLVATTLSRGFRAFVSSRSFTYEYRRTKGKWAGKLIKSGMLIG
jgi:hypothetical protein